MKNIKPTTRLYLKITICLFIITVNRSNADQPQTVEFPSKDTVTITADLYAPHPNDIPLIILLHQARSSRGEYLEIAPILNKMNFNCLAVDLRSGSVMNKIKNKTKADAFKKNKPISYLDAFLDIRCTVKYAKEKYPHAKIILWGSSYSASLALKFAGDYPKSTDAVLAFSPAEYFTKNKTYIKPSAKKIICPVFITSAKNESAQWTKIYDAIPSNSKQFFLPSSKGNHGSKALWSKFDDSRNYWYAVKIFLDKYFPERNQKNNTI